VRRVGVAAVILIVVAGAAVAGYAVRSASIPEPDTSDVVELDVADVVRTDLVQFETLGGTLGFGDERQIRSPLAGTVTALPDEAIILDVDDIAYEIDGESTYVMIGERPQWRPFVDDMTDGLDVLQLETNLADLGYGPDDWEPDQEFDATTGAAVLAWREDRGLDDQEVVDLGRIEFVTGPVRVGAVTAETGQVLVPGAPLFAVTGVEQQVVIELDPDDIGLVAEGDAVEVILPNDTRIGAEIAQVGRIVTASGPEPDAPGVIEVVVAFGERISDLDQAPVDIEVESERAAGVLAVPVRALIALSDGGYAVEVGGRLIGVETGDFAGGLVEVTGALAEGDQVVIPK
jgi:peptidoglycan hydrolase-like protein with peptidoglycan-binding domain